MSFDVFVLIPAFNEEKSIAKVIKAIPNFVREIVVVSNNSADNTVNVAKSAGATVLKEYKQGYGSACLKGIEYINNNTSKATILVFIDGDYSDYPEQMSALLEPILTKNYDMVIGSRVLGNAEKHSMTLPQIFGNWLATTLLNYFYKVKFTDLGPFRAIKLDKLNELRMNDPNYGWTVEMQLKAALKKLRCCEVPTDYRKRIGHSKVSGTIKGTFMAGYKILWTIFKYI